MFADKPRKLGKFSLVYSTIFSEEIVHIYALRLLFSNTIIISTVPNPELDVIEYLAMSDYFEEINIGDIIPVYQPIFSSMTEDSLELSFNKLS